MKDENVILYGIIGLITGVVLTILFTSNVVNNDMTGMMQMMGMHPNNEKETMMNNIDKHFIEQMIPHHEGAIEMAKLAQERATQPEIKTLANSVIKSQSEEITTMKNWYNDWYGTEVPDTADNKLGMGRGMMRGGMMGDQNDMDALKNAKDFDKAFIEEMIPHHQMAVMMANMLAQGTKREEMKSLSRNIIDAQTKEINDMRSWYKLWRY